LLTPKRIFPLLYKLEFGVVTMMTMTAYVFDQRLRLLRALVLEGVIIAVWGDERVCAVPFAKLRTEDDQVSLI
jgi:hypothetical protein